MSRTELSDTVHRRTVGGTEEYAYVANDDRDAGTLTLWLYTRADGFREISTVGRDGFRDAGWTSVDALPEVILEQVSGDEVPYEPT